MLTSSLYDQLENYYSTKYKIPCKSISKEIYKFLDGNTTKRKLKELDTFFRLKYNFKITKNMNKSCSNPELKSSVVDNQIKKESQYNLISKQNETETKELIAIKRKFKKDQQDEIKRQFSDQQINKRARSNDNSPVKSTQELIEEKKSNSMEHSLRLKFPITQISAKERLDTINTIKMKKKIEKEIEKQNDKTYSLSIVDEKNTNYLKSLFREEKNKNYQKLSQEQNIMLKQVRNSKQKQEKEIEREKLRQIIKQKEDNEKFELELKLKSQRDWEDRMNKIQYQSPYQADRETKINNLLRDLSAEKVSPLKSLNTEDKLLQRKNQRSMLDMQVEQKQSVLSDQLKQSISDRLAIDSLVAESKQKEIDSNRSQSMKEFMNRKFQEKQARNKYQNEDNAMNEFEIIYNKDVLKKIKNKIRNQDLFN